LEIIEEKFNLKRGYNNYYCWYCCCCCRPTGDRAVFKRVAGIGAGGAVEAADGDGDVTTATTIRQRRQRQTLTTMMIVVHQRLLRRRLLLQRPRRRGRVKPAGGVDVGGRGDEDDVDARVGGSNRYTRLWYRTAKPLPFRTFSRRRRRPSRTKRWLQKRMRLTTVCRILTQQLQPWPLAVAVTVALLKMDGWMQQIRQQLRQRQPLLKT